jgi:hypothetical protein
MVNCRTEWRLTPAGAIFLLVVSGCGAADWGYLDGTVRLNGQPVGPGTLTLEPVEGDRAGAIASFGEDGKFSIRSARRKEGAPTGEYRVLVYGGESFGEEQTGPRPKSKIPLRYSSPSTTDLTVTIEPGNQTVEFDLKP